MQYGCVKCGGFVYEFYIFLHFFFFFIEKFGSFKNSAYLCSVKMIITLLFDILTQY